MAQIKTGRSARSNPERAVADVMEQLGQERPSLVVYFAPSSLDQRCVHKQFAEQLPNTPFIGGSSLHMNVPFMRMRHNIANDGFCDGLCAFSMTSDQVTAEVGVVEDVTDGDAVAAAKATLERLAARMGLVLDGRDVERYFLLVLCDGPSGYADAILDGLFMSAPELQIVGGGTGGTFSLATGQARSGFAHAPSVTRRRATVTHGQTSSSDASLPFARPCLVPRTQSEGYLCWIRVPKFQACKARPTWLSRRRRLGCLPYFPSPKRRRARFDRRWRSE